MIVWAAAAPTTWPDAALGIAFLALCAVCAVVIGAGFGGRK